MVAPRFREAVFRTSDDRFALLVNSLSILFSSLAKARETPDFRGPIQELAEDFRSLTPEASDESRAEKRVGFVVLASELAGIAAVRNALYQDAKMEGFGVMFEIELGKD